MSDIQRLLRPHVASVPEYSTARSRHQGGTLLDANENSLGTPIPDVDPELHRYPDPTNRALRTALASRVGVRRDAVWVGNGSDEAIDILIRALVEPGSRVAIPVPSYGVYAQRSATQAAIPVPFRLDREFDLDVDAAAHAARQASLCFLCSPNNPTGNLLSRGRILELLDRFDGVLGVDEAYIEFAGEEHSLANMAGGDGPLSRLVVIRTLSKAWGLAGARVGYLVGAADLVEALDRIGLPYPLSRMAAGAALSAIERESLVENWNIEIRAEREWLANQLAELGLRALPSVANFICFFVPDPVAVQAGLAAGHGIIVRDRSTLPGLEGALRVSVGTHAENLTFVDALRGELGR